MYKGFLGVLSIMPKFSEILVQNKWNALVHEKIL